MPLFYAYIANSLDEATCRLLAVFACRAVADEWWRAVSASPHARSIKRVAPQFYAHDAAQCNLSGFFEMPEFKAIAEVFRGRMFFTQLNDGLLGITIIPPQEVTDHINGGWYHIRSVSNHALCWHYDATENKIRASDEEPTQFRINIRSGVPQDTILVGEDRITLNMRSQINVYVEESGLLKARPGSPRDFRFRELESGNFAISEDAYVLFVDNVDSNLRLMSWELLPALSPIPSETTQEHFGENQDNVVGYSSMMTQEDRKCMQSHIDDLSKDLDATRICSERHQSNALVLKRERDTLRDAQSLSRDQSQAAAAVAERELTDLKQLLKSSKADLVLERAYAHQKSQRVAALADRELADWKQQLDVTKSSKAALDARVVSSMHEAADARQQLQVAAAVAEREHADLKRQLDTMKSGKAALDAQQKSLMQERDEAHVTIKRLRDAEDAQAGTFSLDSFRDIVDRVSEAHVSFTGHPSVERLNEAIDNMVLEALEQACEALAAQGDSVAHFAAKPPPLNTPLFASLAKRNLTEEDRGFLLDACLHSLVVPFVYGMFFQSTISTIAVDDQVEVLDKVFSKITAAEPWAVCQRWRAMAASATAIMMEPSELERQAHHIEEQVSRSVAWAYGQPLTTFHPMRAKLLQNITALMHDAHELSLVLKRDILSVQMMVMLDESIGRPYDPRFEESVWPEMGAKTGDSVIGVYALGLRKVTPIGHSFAVVKTKVITSALVREIEKGR